MSTEEETKYWEEFIDIYRENPCLWDNKSDDFKNQSKKNIAYGLLVEKLWEIDDNADIETVKKKIKSLKASLKRELSRCTDNGQEHIPTWRYYKSLSFLTPFEDDTEPVESNSEIQLNTQPVECNSATQLDTENSSNTEPSQDVPADAPDLVVPLQQKLVHLLPKNNARIALYDTPNNVPAVKKRKLSVVEDDDCDDVSAFAAFLKSRMRSFDPLQKCIAQKLISDVIFLAETKQLELTSAITKP